MNLTQWATPTQRVIHEAPAQSRLKDKAGHHVLYKQIRELLLADGSITYGCAHCSETSPDIMVIFRHLRTHKPATIRRPKPKKAAPKPDTNGHKAEGDGLVIQLVETEIAKLTMQRDRYKARALKAERELAKVRRALGIDS